MPLPQPQATLPAMRQFQDKYFLPMPLETWRRQALYRWLGVRLFKRYLLPSERWLHHLRGKPAILAGQSPPQREAALWRLERDTRRNEASHVLALLLTVFISALKSGPWSAWQWLAIVALNLYLNLYPIFVQRYNRQRILRLLAH
jgi:glycosyl-4,4'-diaponeurosporenoate acyltransferase